MAVRTEEETEGRGGRGVRVLEISKQADRRACVRGRRAGKLTGPTRVPQVTRLPPPSHYRHGAHIRNQPIDSVTMHINAS